MGEFSTIYVSNKNKGNLQELNVHFCCTSLVYILVAFSKLNMSGMRVLLLTKSCDIQSR